LTYDEKLDKFDAMKLKDYINLKRITKREVAKDLEITPTYVYEILAGRMIPGRKLAQRIVEWSDNAVTFQDLWR